MNHMTGKKRWAVFVITALLSVSHLSSEKVPTDPGFDDAGIELTCKFDRDPARCRREEYANRRKFRLGHP